MKAPLDGIRIIDFTAYFAGPSAGPWLADFGAEVIKVEPPQGSEERRIFTGPYLQNESLSHQVFSRGKKSIVINVRTSEGKDIVCRLVAQSDAVIHNFRYGVMEELKFDYERLREINPRIIYVNMPAYGDSGPYRDMLGYDIFAQGITGMCLPLKRVEPPFYTPYVGTGLYQADMQEGMLAAYGIALALLVRRRTGRGQKVNTSLMAAGASLLAERLCRVKADPTPPAYFEPPLSPVYRAYDAAGGTALAVAVLGDEDWRRFCQVMSLEHLAADPRYSRDKREPATQRLTAEQEELARLLEERFLEKPAPEWIELLREARIPCGPVYDMYKGQPDFFRTILEDPQVKENDLSHEVCNWFVGPSEIMGTPLKLRETPGWPRASAPLLNQHCDEILLWLGYSKSQIDELKKKRIVTASGFVPYPEKGRPYPLDGRPGPYPE